MTEVKDKTVGGLLAERAQETPDKDFLWCDGSWLTYAELLGLADRFALGLQQLGVAFGDRVATVLPTEHAAVVALFACARMGAIQVPLNTFLRGEFLRYQLANSRASVVVIDLMGFEQVRRVISELPELRTVIVVGDVEQARKHDLGAANILSYEEVLKLPAAGTLPEVTPPSLFSIIYTSGTTGMPKGCLIPHRYAVNMAESLCEAGRFEKGDRVLTAAPLFHTSGQIFAMMSALHSGGSIAFMRELQASKFMALAAELEATVVFGTGAVGVFLMAQPERETDRRHKVRQAVFNGLPEATQLALEARFGFHLVGEMFGHTEFVPMTISPVSGPRRRDSGGIPRADVEVQIFDENDLPVPVGKVGEIVARPRRPGIMFDGYWDNPKATVEMRANLWHHTGDLGRFDADGFLYFADRKKEAIRRRGEFVTARELEAAIIKHPCIAAVAVHAVPSAVTEDDIKAWLVLHPDTSVTPESLFAFFREELPYFAIPRFAEIVPDLPANASNRVMKHVLKERPHTEATWDFDKLGLVVPRHERRA